jgi:hypothetical protein
MPFDEKVGVSVMLALLGAGLFFINSSGRWKFHEINPIRILLAQQDGTLASRNRSRWRTAIQSHTADNSATGTFLCGNVCM